MVKYLTENQLLQDTCERDVSTFCSMVDLSDQDYCYPNVLKSPDLNSNLGQVVEDPRGCLQLCLTEVANNLRNPVLLLHSSDDTHRMFIAEQVGFVWVYLRDGSRLEQPFLDMSGEVLTTPWLGDERGFLGMAFHPKYRDNGRFFIYYSIQVNSILEKVRVSEMKVSVHDMNMADPYSERYVKGRFALFMALMMYMSTSQTLSNTIYNDYIVIYPWGVIAPKQALTCSVNNTVHHFKVFPRLPGAPEHN